MTKDKYDCRDGRPEETILKTDRKTVCLGALEPFKLLHISDTHLIFADERDNERKRELALKRKRHFPHPAENLAAIEKIAGRENALVACTGDLIDFVSEANLDAAKAFCVRHDCFMAAGNHEFSQYVGEAWEDADYRNQTLDRVQACFDNNIRFDTRMVNGIRLVAVDNGYYLFEREQLDALKEACSDNTPVILMMHTPLYTRNLCDIMLNEKKADNAALMGAPEAVLAGYNDHRRRQQTPDDVTKEAVDFILNCENIKMILAGHLHFPLTDRLNDTKNQYLVGTDDVCLWEIT